MGRYAYFPDGHYYHFTACIQSSSDIQQFGGFLKAKIPAIDFDDEEMTECYSEEYKNAYLNTELRCDEIYPEEMIPEELRYDLEYFMVWERDIDMDDIEEALVDLADEGVFAMPNIDETDTDKFIKEVDDIFEANLKYCESVKANEETLQKVCKARLGWYIYHFVKKYDEVDVNFEF